MIRAAIASGSDIRFTYVDLKGARTQRTVRPQRLFSADGMYVEAFCRLRREERTFKIDRMSSIEISD